LLINYNYVNLNESKQHNMKQKLLILLVFTFCNTCFSQNNYLDYDGVNDNVTVPGSENVLASATAISMSCKIYPKTTSSGFPLFDGFAGYRNESNFDFYLIQLTSNQLEARFRNSSGTAFTITYNGLVLNQWSHFFLVYNGSTLKLYNGTTEVGSVAANGSVPATNASTFKIGLIQFQSYNWYHSGYIDEVSLWNKGLSASEISTIVGNSGEIANPSGETNLKLYYKFNQGIPYGSNPGLNSLIDEKATANGTLANFALTGSSSNWGSATLNINSFDENKSVVYPNPTSTILNFSGISEIQNIKIIDLYGRVILDKILEPTEEPSIDVNQLQSGTYIAIINNNWKVKFLKK
jgi:Concanavalin A-like lectin/glucanases superfamily/Secretion system C-terminal sorting domain